MLASHRLQLLVGSPEVEGSGFRPIGHICGLGVLQCMRQGLVLFWAGLIRAGVGTSGVAPMVYEVSFLCIHMSIPLWRVLHYQGMGNESSNLLAA